MPKQSPMPHPNQGRKHFSPVEREEIISKIARLERRGFGMADIASETKMSMQMVYYYMRLLKRRYLEAAVEDRRAVNALRQEQYREIIKESWEAWEASKRDTMHMTEEETDLGKMGSKSKVATKRVTTTGNPAFLRIIMDCLKSLREMMGTDEPTQVNTTLNYINWDRLAELSVNSNRIKVDQVEETIRGVLESGQLLPSVPGASGLAAESSGPVGDAPSAQIGLNVSLPPLSNPAGVPSGIPLPSFLNPNGNGTEPE